MPDPEPGQPAEPAGATPPQHNLPVPYSPPKENGGEGLFVRLARALFGWRSGTTRADIATVIEAAMPGETGVSPEERTMMKNILALRERRVEDVMVPRGDIVAVQQNISLGELVKVFEKAGHSRLVVYDDSLDDPTGMVHIRDMVAFMAAHSNVDPEKNRRRKKPRPSDLDLGTFDLAMTLSAATIVRTILYVPPSMPAVDLLAKMQTTRIHLALVVDEYGGTDGLVSMEDIVEQIVGEIADEHDEDELPSIVRQPDGSFIADARAPLDDVVAAIGPEFDIGNAAEEVDTIGGYLMAQVGRLPLRGELVAKPDGFELEVLDSDPRRIKRVRIHRRSNRSIVRDREGRRRYSTPDNSSTPTIAPAPPADPGNAEIGQVPSDPTADSNAPRRP
jgi:CBS domain containing-hemolysin-like protein